MKKVRQVYKGFLIKWSNRHNRYFVWSEDKVPLKDFNKIRDAREYINDIIKTRNESKN